MLEYLCKAHCGSLALGAGVVEDRKRKKYFCWAGMLTHICNPSTEEAEVGLV